MAHDFPDRSDKLFGRGADIDHLVRRCRQRGITAVFGRAQLGKSWLLTEVARLLSLPESGFILGRKSHLVGYVECRGETADLLPRAAKNLYSKWLAGARSLDQLKAFVKLYRDDGITHLGEAFGDFSAALSKAGGKPSEAAGSAISAFFNELAQANRDLKGGGIQVGKLQIERVQLALEIASKHGKKPIVLILDQWEKSTDLEAEVNALDSFLRLRDEWPQCHIILASRPDGNRVASIEKLRETFGLAVDIHHLGLMNLDSFAEIELLRYIRDEAPIPREMSDATLLSLIGGYPGTVDRWVRSENRGFVTSYEGLKTLAGHANLGHYEELAALSELPEAKRQFAMRLALIPATENPETWKVLKPIIHKGIQGRDLDSLSTANILHSTRPPTFGHAKRYEAAFQRFSNKHTEELADVCQDLIVDLSRDIRSAAPEFEPLWGSLASLTPIAEKFALPAGYQALCLAARSFSQVGSFDLRRWEEIVSSLGPSFRVASPLLAMGVVNGLYSTTPMVEHTTSCGFLKTARRLQNDNPDDEFFAEQVGRCLSIIFFRIPTRQAHNRRALIDQLIGLSVQWPKYRMFASDAVYCIKETIYDVLRYARWRRHANAEFNVLKDTQRIADIELCSYLHENALRILKNFPGDDAITFNTLLATLEFIRAVAPRQEQSLRDQLRTCFLEIVAPHEGEDDYRNLKISMWMSTIACALQDTVSARRAIDEAIVAINGHLKRFPDDRENGDWRHLLDMLGIDEQQEIVDDNGFLVQERIPGPPGIHLEFVLRRQEMFGDASDPHRE